MHISLPLPDDILQTVFDFVGKGQYRFIAGTNQQFKRVYKSLFCLKTLSSGDDKKDSNSNDIIIKKEKDDDEKEEVLLWNQTHLKYVAESVELVKLCLTEYYLFSTTFKPNQPNCSSSSVAQPPSPPAYNRILNKIGRYAAISGNIQVLKFTIENPYHHQQSTTDNFLESSSRQQQQRLAKGRRVVTERMVTRRQKERFLMFLRVLSKYLEHKDSKLYQLVKDIIKDCAERNKLNQEGYESVSFSIKLRLKAVVKADYWKRSELYLKHFLAMKKKKSKPCSNINNNMYIDGR